MVLFCLRNRHYKFLILLILNLFVFLSMRSSKNVEPTSNEETPKDLAAPTSGFKPIYYHADRWYFDTSKNVLIRYHKTSKEWTCSHLRELQTDQLNLRRLRNFERLLWLLKTKLSKWLRMIGKLLMIQSVHLISFGKAGLNSLWFQFQLAEHLKANNRFYIFKW